MHTAVLSFNSTNSFPLALLRPNLSDISVFFAEICLWMYCGGVVFQTTSIPVWRFLYCNHLFPRSTTKHHLDFHCVLLTACLYFRRALAEVCYFLLFTLSLYNQSVRARRVIWTKNCCECKTTLLFYSSHWQPELFSPTCVNDSFQELI